MMTMMAEGSWRQSTLFGCAATMVPEPKIHSDSFNAQAGCEATMMSLFDYYYYLYGILVLWGV